MKGRLSTVDLFELTSLDQLLTRKVLMLGRLSTVDLLELTCLDQLLFITKILFTFFFTKQATLLRSTVLNLNTYLPVLLAQASGNSYANGQCKT